MDRKFSIIDVEPRSPDWFAARLARVTGTAAADMLATVQRGEAASRRDLRIRLVLERLTGSSLEDGFVNSDMRRGIELEPEAIYAYEALVGSVVSKCGFVSHNELAAGVSPDGVIGDFDSYIEVKAPRSATHLRYLRSDGIPAEHRAQIMHGLFVTRANHCDFVSYDPRFPHHLQLVVRRMRLQDVDIAAYELTLRNFLNEVEQEYESILSLKGAA